MITIKDVSFSRGEKILYEDVSFRIGQGQKIGLVGPNGSGKSTLLTLLRGIEHPEKGTIEVTGSIGYVPQEIKADVEMENSETVSDYVDPLHIHSQHHLKRFFSGVELTCDLSYPPKLLSGGQKTKLALAKALLAEPDILLLDEPTNFIDVEGKNWVMKFLSEYQKTVIVISHDLALMDNAIDKILSINPQTHKIEEYKGNYSSYLKLKKEREELLKKQVIVKQKHIKRMEEGLTKMARFTSGKGVRARIRQKKRIEKEKEALPDLPQEIRSIKMSLPIPSHVGELPIRAVKIGKSYGSIQILTNMNMSIRRGERVAFIGPNGAGKSTFIKILMGIINPDSGEVIKNQALKVGYYSQEFETFDMKQPVIDVFCQMTKKDERFARGFLGRFMFMGNKVFQTVETLSGGEKTRLSIAILTACDFNLLILDEPTTYLDVMSQRIILEALKEYQGAMIIVSHTPEFLKELAPSRAFLFPEQKEVYWEDSLAEVAEKI